MVRDHVDEPFLTERRVIGLLGAAVVATVGYWLVTRIAFVEVVLFFLIFAAVFAGLNYALFRYD